MDKSRLINLLKNVVDFLEKESTTLVYSDCNIEVSIVDFESAQYLSGKLDIQAIKRIKLPSMEIDVLGK